jgi:DNA-binding NtrC family response regulator
VIDAGVETATVTSGAGESGSAPAAALHLALVLAWSVAEPHRAGEVALLPGEGSEWTFGRGEPGPGGGHPHTPGSGGSSSGGRVRFVRQRPGAVSPTGPVEGAGISREQLWIRVRRDALLVRRVGRCPVLVNGREVEMEALVPGDTLLLPGQLVLLCARRAGALPPLRDFPEDAAGAFGGPDAFGILGEGPAAWRAREQIAFDAKADNHVLVFGASGTGKELAARAVHALSRRAKGPFVARNAATVPPGLVDAELFGNARGYPNPGTPERPGLVAQADGGTLFLDEIGELPWEAQAHLLRVLDAGGEYHRLGEALPRRASIRLVAATNRAPEELKHDLLARLTLRLPLPGLDARREDIPLLVRHLLGKTAALSPDIGRRFVAPSGEPRVDPALVEHLLRRAYASNVRELETVLFAAMWSSPGDRVILSDAMGEEPAVADEARAAAREPTAEEIREGLRRHGDNLTKAARALGLPSRFVLYRLIKKLGIELSELRGGDGEPAEKLRAPRR